MELSHFSSLLGLKEEHISNIFWVIERPISWNISIFWWTIWSHLEVHQTLQVINENRHKPGFYCHLKLKEHNRRGKHHLIFDRRVWNYFETVYDIIIYAYDIILLCVNHCKQAMRFKLSWTKKAHQDPTTSNMLTMAPYFFFTSHIILSHPVSTLQPRIVSVNFSLSTPMVVLSWGPWNPWWTVVLNGKQNAVRFVLPRQRWRQAAWRYSFFFFGWGNGRGWDWRGYEISESWTRSTRLFK